MNIETEIELVMTPENKYHLWGIMHHHVHIEQLDEKEVLFREELIRLLDPYKEYETKYKAL